MTIIEAINKTDALKSNTYTQDEKVAWLNNLEWRIKQEVIDTHEGGEDVIFTGYDGDINVTTTELIAKAPHDEVYLRWMQAQIDYYNGEINKYNLSITMFNAAYEGFCNYYNRTHMPSAAGNRFLF